MMLIDEAAKSVYRELPHKVAEVLQKTRQADAEYAKVAKLVLPLQARKQCSEDLSVA